MKILVPVDGSAESLAAVRHALALVREGLRASLLLVNVQEPAGLYELLRVHDADAIETIAREAGEHLLAEGVALCQAAGVDHEIEVARGEPTHALLDIAEDEGCTLIVAGAHGKGESEGRRLGSVAHALLHDASLPVTVVRSAL
ncbi:MAG: universal stress protein [Proteobacteria bacterium]|nr:universal stress protein [Pseudomonadota bacterium]